MDKRIELMAKNFISNKYSDLNLFHIDQNKMVIEHNELKLKIAIPFNNEINFDELSEEVNGLEIKDAIRRTDEGGLIRWQATRET